MFRKLTAALILFISGISTIYAVDVNGHWGLLNGELGPGKYKLICLGAGFNEGWENSTWNQCSTSGWIGKCTYKIGENGDITEAPGAWSTSGFSTMQTALTASRDKSTCITITQTVAISVWYNCHVEWDWTGTYWNIPATGTGKYVIYKAYANVTGFQQGGDGTDAVPEEKEENSRNLIATCVPCIAEGGVEIPPSKSRLVKIALDQVSDETTSAKLSIEGPKHKVWKDNSGTLTKVDISTLNNELLDLLKAGSLAYYIQPIEKGEFSVKLTCKVDGNDDTDIVKIKAEECETCKNSCAAGETKTGRDEQSGDVYAGFSMGGSATDSYNGTLNLSIPSAPSGNLISVSNLQSVLRSSDNNEIITGSSGSISQIKTSSVLIAATTFSDYKYQLEYYTLDNVGEKGGDTSEEYAITGDPYRVVTVEDPDQKSTTETIKITNTITVNGTAVGTVDEIRWNGSNGSWDIVTGNGAKTDGFINGGYDSNNQRESYSTVKDSQGVIVYKEKIKTQYFPWGAEIIEKVVDPDGSALTTTYSYYDNSATDGGSYGLRKSVSNYDTSWERYAYDDTGRKIKTVSPFANSSVTDGESLCKVVETVYDDANNITATITKALGTEVARSYEWQVSDFETRNITCTVAGAAYNAATNFVVVRKYYSSGPFAGKIKSIFELDRLLKLYEYGYDSNYVTETIYEGAGNSTGDTVTDGTKTVTKKNVFGRDVYKRTYDIATNKVIGFSSSSAVDALGRPTAVQDMDGTVQTTVYGCCGPARTTDKAGTETVYGYDDQKRLSYKTTAGVTKLYTYDAMDRTVAETEKASSGAEISSATTYNLAGQTVAETNDIGDSTLFSQAVINGQLVKTTTYADGSTLIQKLNKNGTPAEISGTAVHPVTYEYGVENGELYVKTYPTDRTTEWVKKYTHFFGIDYKTVYADSSSEVISLYNPSTRTVLKVGPSGIMELTVYDARRRVSVVAIDMNRNGTIDYSGTDIIKKYEYGIVEDSGVVCSKQTTKACLTDGNATETVISEDYKAANGLSTKNVSFDRTSTQNMTYNASGSITVLTTNPDGSTLTNSYQNGKLITSVHSVLGTTTYTYDEFNRQISSSSTVNGSSRVNSQELDSLGRPSVVTDAAGRETVFTYDQMGRRVKAELPGNRSVYYRYWPTGELKEQFGNDIYPLRKVLDSVGRLKTLETYKSFKWTGPQSGYKTTWTYSDTRGFMTGKTYPDNHSVSYTYNASGSPLTRTWARGITTTYTYDNAGMPSSVSYSDATTPAINFTRNRLSLPVSITDGTGTRSVTYNSDSTLASETVPYIVNHSLSYGYDGNGRRTSMNLLNNSTPLATANYTYDGMSRLSTVSDGTRTATYSRVSGSNLLSGINMNSVVSVTKSYDVLDRLTSISSTAGTKTYSFNYTYNDADKRSKCTLADGTYWIYDYDDLGQIIRGKKYASNDIEIPGQSFGYDYDTIGNLKTENRNGSVYDYTSNNVNQYTERTIPGYINIAGKADPDARVTIHRTSLGTGGYTKATRYGAYYNVPYTLDNSSSAVSETFDIYAVKYDSTNNRDVQAKQTLTVNIPQTPQAFTYDNDGNMTGDNKFAYTWDGENRLTKVEETNTQKVENTFDYGFRWTNRKVYNYVSGNWVLESNIKFIYSGWLLIAEVNGETNNILKIYTWGEDLSGSLTGAGGVGGLLSVLDSTGVYYPVYDGNGNITAYVDSTGAKVAEYTYDPFGNIISKFGTKCDDFNFLFSTKYYDRKTGLYYYGYRFYSPKLARWLGHEPLGETESPNLFTFVNNNPISSIDYLGQDAIKDIKSGYDEYSRRLAQMRFDWLTKNIDKLNKWKDENYKSLKEKLEGLCPQVSCFKENIGKEITRNECMKASAELAENIITTIFYIKLMQVYNYGSLPPGSTSGTIGAMAGDISEGFLGGRGVQCNQWAEAIMQSVKDMNTNNMRALGKNDKRVFDVNHVTKVGTAKTLYVDHNWIEIWGPCCNDYTTWKGDIGIDPWPTGGENIYRDYNDAYGVADREHSGNRSVIKSSK